MAESEGHGLQRGSVISPGWGEIPRKKQLSRLVQPPAWPTIPESRARGAGDGIPERAHRNKAIGNAVVPQIPELIGYAILDSM